MEVRPPHLVGPGDPGARGLSVPADIRTGIRERLAGQPSGRLHPAGSVMSGLVATAIEHARPDLAVTVSRRSPGRYRSVREP